MFEKTDEVAERAGDGTGLGGTTVGEELYGDRVYLVE